MDRPPLFRLQLFRLAEHAYRLVFTFHHLLLDARSLPLLFQELHALYDERREPASLPAPGSYQAFLQWHSGWLTAQEMRLRTYWEAVLGDFERPTVPQLASSGDAAQSAIQGATPCSRLLGMEATRLLRTCAADLDVTLATLFQGAWALILGSYSGIHDVVFGTLRHGRSGHVPHAPRTPGLFVNTLPLRVCFRAGETLGEFFRRVRQQNLELREVEQTPLAAVRSWSGVAAGKMLFESLISFEAGDPAHALRRAFGNCPTRRFELLDRAPFPLTLSIDGEQQLHLRVAFDATRYDGRVVERLTADLESLLLRLPTLLDRPVETIHLLAPEQQQLLREWNRTGAALPTDRLLHQWVEQRVDEQPEAVAVDEPTGPVTYGQLEAAANRLGHYLGASGAEPDQFAGLLVRRSSRAVIAALGVLKSGAAYLPLDPDAPPDRLRFQLEHAGVRLVVVEGSTKALLPDGPWQVICLDVVADRLGGQATTRPNCAAGPAHLCYGIYTSGSTGVPKLVGVEHRNAANLLAFATQQVLTPADVHCVPFTDSLSADASVHQIFVTLANGGTLALVENPLEIAASPHFSRFTYLGSTPSLLASLLSTAGLPPSVRTVGLGAEPIPERLVRQLAELVDVEKVVNFYGPTEATVYCTLDWVIDRRQGAAAHHSSAVPGSWCIIGRPIANTEIRILDELMRPAPIGVSGEIYVGGAGVARGYSFLPEQSAARFLTALDESNPERRYYRTGDLGKFLPDGRIEFLGRLDDQVKIRGYRIEPGEVAAVLKQVPGIRDVAVVAHRESEETRLVAYYVAEGLDEPALRAAVRRTLPAHFVPAAFVRLPTLPLTASGKLDRRALPRPSTVELTGETVHEPPQDELQLRIARLWQRLLKRRCVGVRDSFFDLGGHSFLAVTLLAEIEREFGHRLPLSLLVRTPTVEALAEALRTGDVRTRWQSVVPIQPFGRRPPFFAVHGIGGGVLCFRELARHLGPEQPLYGLQAVSLGGAEREYERIEAMAAHYVRELREVQADGPYSLGGLSFGGTVALEMAHQLLEAGEQVAALVLLDSKGPEYPQFPCWPRRLAAHLQHFRSLTGAARRSYLDVRIRSAYDLTRRRWLNLRYQGQQALPLQGTLRDLGVAHLRAAHQYEHRLYPGTATLLRAERQPIGCIPEPCNGWDRVVRGRLEVLPVPGDHASLLEAPNLRVVAERITEILARS